MVAGDLGSGSVATEGSRELVDAPLENLAPIPEGVDPVTASLTEPLAVTVRGVGLGAGEPDSKVLVLGAGAIGLCAALVARDRADEVAITARYPHQRDAAAHIGLTVLGEGDAVEWGKQHRPEVVIESVGGTADTLTDAVRVVGAGRPGRRAGHVQRTAPRRPAAPDDEGGLDRRLVLLWQR